MLGFNTENIEQVCLELAEIQKFCKNEFGTTDIFSGSKFYEMIIANQLNHEMIPGQSGTKDGKDHKGEYEYKHFKEQSSNHSWTFNDYTDATIDSLKKVVSAIFAHIDTDFTPPKFDWYIEVEGKICSSYLKHKTETLLKTKPKGKVNARKMINISPNQIELDLGLKKTYTKEPNKSGKYYETILKISSIQKKLEKMTGVDQILTGNKIFEVLVASKLEHTVFSEQKKHDAHDEFGNLYEYKNSKSYTWNFQDISDAVLKKYEDDKAIILTVVDKINYRIKEIWSAEPSHTIPRLKEKLEEKRERRKEKDGSAIRRLSVSLSKGDLNKIKAKKIFPN